MKQKQFSEKKDSIKIESCGIKLYDSFFLCLHKINILSLITVVVGLYVQISQELITPPPGVMF